MTIVHSQISSLLRSCIELLDQYTWIKRVCCVHIEFRSFVCHIHICYFCENVLEKFDHISISTGLLKMPLGA